MPLALRCPIAPPLIREFLVNLAGGTAAVAATPMPSTSNDDAGEVVMVLLVWYARGAAGVLQCLLHLDAGRRVLPTQPRHRLSPLMLCKLSPHHLSACGDLAIEP
jgi:hypothetical protein